MTANQTTQLGDLSLTGTRVLSDIDARWAARPEGPSSPPDYILLHFYLKKKNQIAFM